MVMLVGERESASECDGEDGGGREDKLEDVGVLSKLVFMEGPRPLSSGGMPGAITELALDQSAKTVGAVATLGS